MELILDNIYKSYGSLPVLSGVSMKIASPDICCLMAPSGTGKTTLFRLIMGLEKPDSGTICPAPEQIRFSAVFQEDRLIPEFSPLENVALALPGRPDRPSLFRELARLLPEEAIIRPVSTLSGGMKRRCCAPCWLPVICSFSMSRLPAWMKRQRTGSSAIFLRKQTDVLS